MQEKVIQSRQRFWFDDLENSPTAQVYLNYKFENIYNWKGRSISQTVEKYNGFEYLASEWLKYMPDSLDDIEVENYIMNIAAIYMTIDKIIGRMKHEAKHFLMPVYDGGNGGITYESVFLDTANMRIEDSIIMTFASPTVSMRQKCEVAFEIDKSDVRLLDPAMFLNRNIVLKEKCLMYGQIVSLRNKYNIPYQLQAKKIITLDNFNFQGLGEFIKTGK